MLTRPIWAKQRVTPMTSNEHGTSPKKGEMKLRIPCFWKCYEFHFEFKNMCEHERFSTIKPCVCDGGESKQK